MRKKQHHPLSASEAVVIARVARAMAMRNVESISVDRFGACWAVTVQHKETSR